MKRLVLAIALCSAAFTAWAQHQPYAGHQDRAIKALSAEEIEQYLSGSGMGFAKPAELNGYPGPMHVIELADKLLLTPTQRIQTQALMDEHKRAARELGARLVAADGNARKRKQLADGALRTLQIVRHQGGHRAALGLPGQAASVDTFALRTRRQLSVSIARVSS